MRSIGIAIFHVVLILAYVLFHPFEVSAQEKPKEGDTITAMVAICDTVTDAATLIGLVTTYGVKTAIGWTQEPDNTCALMPVTFTIGAVEISGMKDKQGAEWSIVRVTVEGTQLFTVIPSASFATPISY